MTGKTHAKIGFLYGAISTVALYNIGSQFVSEPVAAAAGITVLLGAVQGSLTPDIDAKNSLVKGDIKRGLKGRRPTYLSSIPFLPTRHWTFLLIILLLPLLPFAQKHRGKTHTATFVILYVFLAAITLIVLQDYISIAVPLSAYLFGVAIGIQSHRNADSMTPGGIKGLGRGKIKTGSIGDSIIGNLAWLLGMTVLLLFFYQLSLM